ncbi:hypothetical protein XA68_17548 [Ophiocordyceps unilateralis]|uniref:Core domain-containing protein n=1 Tax=Ophiocordyceps unilateralis TaxID=268505 RepID=A0A2A9PKG4_OPHUN|nr:hypothetical protein XA68_17548 [Ophiocordyceps unilateralis]
MTFFSCANGPSVARSFVKLACPTRLTGKTILSLDFLTPRGAASTRGLRTACCPSQRIPPTSASRVGCFSPRTQNRNFVSSPTRNATKCVLHPRKDDDGNDMMLEITSRAATRLNEIRNKDDNPNLALRIQVESGGCHGFQYLISLVNIPGKDPREWSSAVAEDDSIFQYYPDPPESNSGQENPIVILDEPSLQLLKGSKVDFTMELIGSQFKIVDNPFATSSCGCGTSFDIKL